MRFCKSAKIEVITKSEAFDIAFNNTVENGNLIYNPDLINNAKIFLPTGNVPNKPDGYYGDCVIEIDSATNENVLFADYQGINTCYYDHYGVPTGNLTFSCNAKGSGNIGIYAIRNNTPVGNVSDLIASIDVTESEYTAKSSNLFIKDEPIIAYNGVDEGLSNKICGLLS